MWNECATSICSFEKGVADLLSTRLSLEYYYYFYFIHIIPFSFFFLIFKVVGLTWGSMNLFVDHPYGILLFSRVLFLVCLHVTGHQNVKNKHSL